MNHSFKWLPIGNAWRSDFDTQRRRAINIFTILAALSSLIFSIYHLVIRSSGITLAANIILLAVFIALWRVNVGGFKKWVGITFLLAVLVFVTINLHIHEINHTFIIYGLLTMVASFFGAPFYSFFMALISIGLYSAAYFLSPQAEGYNLASVIALLVLSFFSFQIAQRLHVALYEAGSNEVKYLELANTTPALVYLLENGHTGRWVHANPYLTQLLGYQTDEWCQQPGLWEASLHPEDREWVLAEEARALKEKGAFTAEYRLLRKDGRMVWVSDHSTWTISRNGTINGQGIMLNISSRKRAEQIREATYTISQSAYAADNLSELYALIHHVLGTLIRAENFFIALYDDQTEIIQFPYFMDEYDTVPAPFMVKRGLTHYVLTTGRPLFASPQVFQDLQKKGIVESVGTPSIDWLGVPLKVKDRTIGAMVVQSYHEGERYDQEALDILTFISTQVANAIERKRAEETIRIALEEKEVLLREIHHRVKNNLQVITGLLSLQADHLDDPKVLAVFNDSRARISSMSLVHQALYQSNDLARVNIAEYFQMLVDHLGLVYGSPNIRIVIRAEDLLINIEKAIPLGLIVNELITNSMKYAFPDQRSGTVQISLQAQVLRGDEREYILEVADDGVGLPENINTAAPVSFGLQIVNMLIKQLKGSLQVKNTPGATYQIRFKG